MEKSNEPEVSSEEEVDAEACLELIAQLFTEQKINEEQRDALKGKLAKY